MLETTEAPGGAQPGGRNTQEHRGAAKLGGLLLGDKYGTKKEGAREQYFVGSKSLRDLGYPSPSCLGGKRPHPC